MSRKITAGVFLLTLGLCFYIAGSAFAVGSGGFENQVLSGKALGMGNAFAGQADDATAVYFNPAGMTQLEGVNVSLGLNVLAPSNEFTATVPGTVSQDADDDTFFIPDMYLTWKAKDKLSFGLGVYSNFGLSTDWGETGSLRYVATSSELNIYSIAPCAAYKISDKLSAGVGVEYYMLTNISMKSMIPTGLGDISKELSGDGDGIGATASVLYSLFEKHKIGVTYRTEAKIDIDGDIKIPALSYNASAESSITLPPRAIIGYSWKATDKMIVNADYEWTGWSTYDELVVKSAGSSTIYKKNYKDVSSVGLGTEYTLNDSWKLRGGWFYFESPVTQKYYTPSVPDTAKNCITLGCGFLTKNNFTIDAGYGYLMGLEREIVNGTCDGKYSSTTHLLSLNAGYKF